MANVMIDIETLGRRPGCVILSIGAVPFCQPSGSIGETFYDKIDPRDCARAGLVTDPETINWWNKQEHTVKAEAFSGVRTLAGVLTDLTEYLKSLGALNKLKVWGNGAGFDVPILEAAYAAVDLPVPWQFWNSMCYRTLKTLYPQVIYAKPINAHNALDDAIAQAIHAQQILSVHNSKTGVCNASNT